MTSEVSRVGSLDREVITRQQHLPGLLCTRKDLLYDDTKNLNDFSTSLNDFYIGRNNTKLQNWKPGLLCKLRSRRLKGSS